MYNPDSLPNHDKIEISDDTRIYIIDKLVEPYYKNIIKNTINGRLCWRKTGILFETVSKIMVAFGSILSFSAGYYHDETLSFISGSISCLSLAFLQLSSFSYKENKKQSEELNILLKKLKLDTIPVFERQADTQMRSYQRPTSIPIYNPPYNPPYNPYNPYNLHDNNTDYNYNKSINHYTPPSRNIIPSRSMPSISKIPKRVSSINSAISDIEEHEPEVQYTTEDIINISKFLDEYKKQENINTENNTQENNTYENDTQEYETPEYETPEEKSVETKIKNESTEDIQEEPEVINTIKPNLLQKTVNYLFN